MNPVIIQNMLCRSVITILIMSSHLSEKELSGLGLSKLHCDLFSFGLSV